MSARFWSRLQVLLQDQRSFAASSLRVPKREEDASGDAQVAALLQGQCARARSVDAAIRKACDYVDGLQDVVDTLSEVRAEGEGSVPVVEIVHYGLKPQGENDLHDWAFQRLKEGAGSDVVPVVEVDASSSAPKEDANEDEVTRFTSLCDGVFEADVSLLDLQLSGAILAGRKVMRSWKECVDLCVKIVAALDGKGKKMSAERIDRLKISMERADASAEKARAKADVAVKRAAALAAKTAERMRAAKRQDEEVIARKESVSKEKEQRRKKLLEEKEQQRKQASFMKKFVQPVVAKEAPLPEQILSDAILVDGPGVGGHMQFSAGDRPGPTGNPACQSKAKHYASAPGAEPSVTDVRTQQGAILGPTADPVSQSRISDSASRDSENHVPSLVLVSLPKPSSPENFPVSRWLQSAIRFLSVGEIDVACSMFQTRLERQGSSLQELILSSRLRRLGAEARLPALLRYHRRTRRENRPDLAPRFARRRADLRGHAGERFGYAPIKLLQFHGELRPPYIGTVRRQSAAVRARRPLARDSLLDYGYDSADEWEEDENDRGESLSDDDKDKELEEAELQNLGMLNSESETDDDDFLDDGDADIRATDNAEREITEDFDDGVDDGEPASARPGHPVIIDVDNVTASTLKRVHGGALEELDIAVHRKRKRLSKGGLRPPRIVVVGPVLYQDFPDCILDRYPVRLHDGALPVADDDLNEGQSFDLVHSPSTNRGTQTTSRRRREVLQGQCLDDVARIVHGSSRGRDAIVEIVLSDRRKRNLQVPTKAEVHRAIDRLASRSKNAPWQLRDPLITSRLGLSHPSTRNAESSAKSFCATPTTPQLASDASEHVADVRPHEQGPTGIFRRRESTCNEIFVARDADSLSNTKSSLVEPGNAVVRSE
jgi:hypothetical protein